MNQVAQTNLQLYRQLRDSGVSSQDLQRVAKAYELVMTLCSSMYRPNGKPFVCHLVGTASILHSVGAHIDIVTAGLLHSAYRHGDFGLGRGRLTGKNRRIIRREVGETVEDLVFRYTHFEWNHSRLDAVLESLPDMDRATQDILLMRLADLLDDHVDLGRLYERNAAKEINRRERRDAYSRLARAAGFSELAQAMDRISEDMMAVSVEEGMILDRQGMSFALAPASYRRRAIAALYCAPEAARTRLRRAKRFIRRIGRPEPATED